MALAKDLKKDSLEVVGVSMDQGDPTPIHRFAKDYSVSYLLARGIGERSFSLGVPLPTTQVFDRHGKLAITTVGAIESESFRGLLRKLLAEPSPWRILISPCRKRILFGMEGLPPIDEA